MSSSEPDRSDPAVRAADRLWRGHARVRRRGKLLAGSLVLLAAGIVIAAYPVTSSPGAVVGAVAAAVVLVALAGVAMPQQWSAAERRHRELEAIWHELRTDAGEAVPWDRFAAWAESHGEGVSLYLLREAAGEPGREPWPSRFSRKPVKTLPADEMEDAVAAMEELRAEASVKEQQARAAYERARAQERNAEYDEALRTVERSASEYQAARETEMLREVSEQEAAERRAQAEALARGLRRS